MGEPDVSLPCRTSPGWKRGSSGLAFPSFGLGGRGYSLFAPMRGWGLGQGSVSHENSISCTVNRVVSEGAGGLQLVQSWVEPSLAAPDSGWRTFSPVSFNVCF